MIPKALAEIRAQDIHLLMGNQVHESKTIEYKRSLPETSANSHRVPFLAEICAFANTAGGDLIYGIEEDQGLPVAIPGLDVEDWDAEILRLGNMIRTGLEPQLSSYDMHLVTLENGGSVLIIRVRQSWNAPHRVSADSRFYGRNSAGKYALDVQELRHAFTLTEQITDRIRRFRADRINTVYGGQTPTELLEGPKLMFHLIPMSAFTTRHMIDISVFQRDSLGPALIGGDRRLCRINLEGIFSYEDDTAAWAYTQLYRTGIIEATLVLNGNGQDKFIDGRYESELVRTTQANLALLSQTGFEPPLFAFLTLIGIREYSLTPNSTNVVGRHQARPTDRDIIDVPEILIQSYDEDLPAVFKLQFDIVWNAFGFLCSMNYDTDGTWKG